MRVTVVGGGLAGLTAALDLTDDGHEVTVLEARPRLGGLTASFRRDGLWVDTGQHVFLRCCTAYTDLLERLGVRGDVHLQPRLDVPVQVGGRRTALRRDELPVPLHLSRGLLRYLGPVGALRAAVAGVQLARQTDDDRTLGDWLAAHGQRPREIERLWALLTVATLNAPVADASLALAATVVRTGLFETPGGADTGWAAVPLQQLHGDAFARALVGRAEVRPGAKVTALDGTAVVVDGERFDADAVVLAVPPEVAGPLLGRTFGLGASPIVNLHVVYDRPVLDVPLLATPDSPLQWLFDRTGPSGLRDADPARGGVGGQYVAASVSAADAWLPRRAAEITARLLPEITRVLPAAAGAGVVDAFVTREPRATFRQVAGSARRRPGPGSGRPGVVLAGAWTATGWPATMEGAVRSGHAAARAVLSLRRQAVAA